MRFTRHTFSMLMFSIIAAFCVFSSSVYGRSLYAITTCDGDINSTLTAYNIVGEQVEYRTDTQIDDGSIGLALDPDSETLFATYDYEIAGNENKIVLINAKTMQRIKSIPTTDELCGIAFDKSKQKLYAVSRADDKLYVYLWDPINQTLTLENGTYKTLSNLYGPPRPYGIALD